MVETLFNFSTKLWIVVHDWDESRWSRNVFSADRTLGLGGEGLDDARPAEDVAARCASRTTSKIETKRTF